jgi:hypothetical protein
LGSTTSEAPLPSVEEVPDIWWARSTSCYGKLWGGVGEERRKATNKIDTLTPSQSILLLNLVVSASNNSLYLSRVATQIVLKLLRTR